MALIDIRVHGAVGDGVTNDAPAIQPAVDEVAAAGGGTVLVPAGGVFLSGSIVLRTGVELHEHAQPWWGAALEVRDVDGLRLSGFRGVAGRAGVDAVIGA